MKKIISLILAGVLSAGLFSGCSSSPKPIAAATDVVFDSVAVQNIYTLGTSATLSAEELTAKGSEILQRLSKEADIYDPDSQISKINENAGVGEPVEVDPDLLYMISVAQIYGYASDGKFDPTIGVLSSKWDFNPENPVIPSGDDLQADAVLVNYADIAIDHDNTQFLKNLGMKLDLGGSAKGDGCNFVREMYEENGVTDALIQIGGSIATLGEEKYTIGIRDPNGTQDDIFAKVTIDGGMSLATAGDYERSFEKDGELFHHILDAETGWPVTSDFQSVTVIAQDASFADFMSTYLFIAGKDYVEAANNASYFDVIAVGKDGQVYVTDQIKENFFITNDEYSYATGEDEEFENPLAQQ